MTDKKPLINDAGKIRPMRTGETTAVANGGTGAATAADARTALDVYSTAEVDGAIAAGGGGGAYGSLTGVPAAIDAIDGLTPAADRLAYYTGGSTAALAPLTSAGRDLIDDADAAAQRTTLDVYSKAEVDAAISGGGGSLYPALIHATFGGL